VPREFAEIREDFLGYYNRELAYLRQLGEDFGRKHPAVASRLRFERDQCDDPHVERLIESFAFLAARIHFRLDDEFPEITGALLEELYPNFLRPVPSTALVEFQIDPSRGKATTGRKIPRGTPIHSRPSEGFVCRFHTCQDTDLLPLNIDRAVWGHAASLPPALVDRPTAAVLELRISCMPEVSFESLGLSRLRFHLTGTSDVTFPLYELLLSRCHKVIVRDAEAVTSARMFEATVGAGGFGDNEGLRLDFSEFYDGRSRQQRAPRRRAAFFGYELLEDYFAFPEKFLVVDIEGLEKFRGSGISKQASILFLISPFERTEWRSILENGISSTTFRLNCAPIVNLFPVASDPIQVRRNVFEAAIPVHPRMEIYSVESISGQVSSSAERMRFEKFIDCDGEETTSRVAGYWRAVRRPSRHDANTSEMFVSLMDRQGTGVDARADTLTARLICTNRDWPFRLPVGDPKGDFQMEEFPEIERIICLRRPTAGSPAPSAKTSLWRLISQLSLNHLSLIEKGKSALQCLLRIHNFAGLDFGDENIDGIADIASSAHFARVSSQHGMAFVRGKRVEILMNEDRFAGSGIFLFGTVVERFLGLYTSLNSFSQLALKSQQRGGKTVHIWPPRAGAKVVA
jgi:type VI secretion system protein ImpG